MTISCSVLSLPTQTEEEDTNSFISAGPMAPPNLVQPASHVIHQVGRAAKIATTQSSVPVSRPTAGCPRYGVRCRPFYTTKATESSSSLVGENKEIKTVGELKVELYQLLQGINRGIFGVPSSKKSQIHALVELLEFQNPMPEPTSNLDKVGGGWKLVYSTITILGSRRTKLGLRDFIALGDFIQHIDVAEGKAVNQIKFDVRGLNLLNGKLSIRASFDVASPSRVNIKYESSTITPNQLLNVFRKNYDLLLGIFNPEGWLEITFVDDNLRIGRDNKGNIFILERCEDDKR